MDKSQIINEIKSHLNIKTDSELANELGVSQPTISAWRKRNTLDYELIITKCKIFNPEWLITGKGNILKNDIRSNEINIDFKELAETRKELLDYKDKEIKELKDQINILRSKIL